MEAIGFVKRSTLGLHFVYGQITWSSRLEGIAAELARYSGEVLVMM
jgi:hypothetical protein